MIWTCPDCSTGYTFHGGGTMRFCPQCKVIEANKMKMYWVDRTNEMRNVANEILEDILK